MTEYVEVSLCVVWARTKRYGPQFVGAWPDAIVEHWPEVYKVQRYAAEENFKAMTEGSPEDEQASEFFATYEKIPRPLDPQRLH